LPVIYNNVQILSPCTFAAEEKKQKKKEKRKRRERKRGERTCGTRSSAEKLLDFTIECKFYLYK
jgi:hypothetical protein